MWGGGGPNAFKYLIPKTCCWGSFLANFGVSQLFLQIVVLDIFWQILHIVVPNKLFSICCNRLFANLQIVDQDNFFAVSRSIKEVRFRVVQVSRVVQVVQVAQVVQVI